MPDLALVTIMAVWGSTFAVVRVLVQGAGVASAPLSPLLLVAVRMGLASALLFCFLLATPGGRLQLREAWKDARLLRDGLICGLLLGLGFLLQIEGQQRTTASRSGFLTGLVVIFVPLIELFAFGRRPGLTALAGVLLAFSGLTILASPWLDAAQATLAGDWLTVGCAIAFALHILALGRVASRHAVLPLLLLQLCTTALLAAAAGPFVERQHILRDGRVGFAVLYLALFATLLAFGVQTWAQKRLAPVRVALISALEPVFAALWAALLIGERMTPRELAGGGLIVLGVVVGEAGGALLARARAAS